MIPPYGLNLIGIGDDRKASRIYLRLLGPSGVDWLDDMMGVIEAATSEATVELRVIGGLSKPLAGGVDEIIKPHMESSCCLCATEHKHRLANNQKMEPPRGAPFCSKPACFSQSSQKYDPPPLRICLTQERFALSTEHWLCLAMSHSCHPGLRPKSYATV